MGERAGGGRGEQGKGGEGKEEPGGGLGTGVNEGGAGGTIRPSNDIFSADQMIFSPIK